MSMRYNVGKMNGLYLTSEEADEFLRLYKETEDLEYEDDEEIWTEFDAIIVDDYGEEGWFCGTFENWDTVNNCSQGDIILPIHFQGSWVDFLNGNQYEGLALATVINDAREKYGRFLPNDFKYKTHIGTFIGCFFG